MGNTICIIPARSGSKGLIDKNIKMMNGKPLIAWTIIDALACREINKVVVSTDSLEYARIAKSYGAEVPYIRKAELSKDDTSSFEVIKDCLDYFKDSLEEFNYIILLEPTSPVRKISEINEVLDRLKRNNIKTIVTVCKAKSCHPSFMYSMNKESKLEHLNLGDKLSRRQEISEIFYPDGSIYASEVTTYLKAKGFYHNQTHGYEISERQSFEVDDQEDFAIIELILNKEKNES